MKNILIVVIIIIVIFGLFYFFRNGGTPPIQDTPIGGSRDTNGCLNPAGYGFNEGVGACLRAFEMTPDIMKATKIAVDYVGRGYALTVVSFNSYEEVGAYDIVLERGVERTTQTVYIKNWNVQSTTP